MKNRTRKWAGVFLCIFFASLKAFAEPVSIEGQKTSSWTDYFSRFLVFWQDDADRKADTSQHSTDAWKKIPVDFSDFLPDNLPGISEYRQAMKYRLWQNRPSHQEQEVYDLFGISAQKGNVSAMAYVRPSFRDRISHQFSFFIIFLPHSDVIMTLVKVESHPPLRAAFAPFSPSTTREGKYLPFFFPFLIYFPSTMKSAGFHHTMEPALFVCIPLQLIISM